MTKDIYSNMLCFFLLINLLLIYQQVIAIAIPRQFSNKNQDICCISKQHYWIPKYSIDQVLTMKVSKKISPDMDMDPCKAGSFNGDIARPTAAYEAERRNIHKENKEETIIDVNNDNNRDKRAATAREERIWDHAVIPYTIDANFTGGHKALFKQAMRHWENYTCIQFVKKTEEHQNWIVFTIRPCGCCSFVGKRGNGPQAISIGKNCDKFGIVVHEIGHAVGFWHEHTRPDRDDWVSIYTENIVSGQEYNFNKLPPVEVNSLGMRYDYASIMHYSRNTFSKQAYKDTILPREELEINKDKMPMIGQRLRLSKGDIAQTMALYGCAVCGRTYLENHDSFGSPQHSSYSPNPDYSQKPFQMGDECQWRIIANNGETISLNITSLDIPASRDCESNYLEIRDGYWSKSNLIAKLCGNKIPEMPLNSTGSRLFLTYKTDINAEDHMGFTVSYKAVCGGKMEMDSGTLESPGYPDTYLKDMDCVWVIKVPEGYQVALKFQSFEIENHDSCFYDFIEIRDGPNENSNLIGTYCGYKPPEDINSSTNELYVRFTSDSSVHKAGFSATFTKEFDECSSPEFNDCEYECLNTLGDYKCSCQTGYELHSDEKHCENACGGTINATNGTITSPSFPDVYPANKNCVWNIVAPENWRVTLNFTHFDIEGNLQECEYDNVNLSSQLTDGDIRKHGSYCGSRPPPVITSESNYLRLNFQSDNSVQKSGFSAVYYTDKDECAIDNGGCQHICKNTLGSYNCQCHQGFVLHENSHNCTEGGCKHEITVPIGEFNSPDYPNAYPAKKDCVWFLSTIPGHRIKLNFESFDMEPHQECAYDHIQVYDGHNLDDSTLGRFCGNKKPHNVVASSSEMLLTFTSDGSVQKKGFKIQHSTVCGGTLLATSEDQYFFSHALYGYNNSEYKNNEDCDWIIEAPEGKHVKLFFSNFSLEEGDYCNFDHIEVFSGYDDSGKSYGRFCGSTTPPVIVSQLEALLVRFQSDDTINNKGFSATYVAVDIERNDYY